MDVVVSNIKKESSLLICTFIHPGNQYINAITFHFHTLYYNIKSQLDHVDSSADFNNSFVLNYENMSFLHIRTELICQSMARGAEAEWQLW